VARAFVALGGNIGDRAAYLNQALLALRQAGNRIVAVSDFYESAPVGGRAQRPFWNAVAAIETTRGPRALLRQLQGIEFALGRRRDGARGGPRTIDLDLLAYGQVRMRTRELTLPHPRLCTRRFVLLPLRDLRGLPPAAGQPPGQCLAHPALRGQRVRRLGGGSGHAEDSQNRPQ
jgi:2-amino-4-hydroxy-6-hydroxymethyldihydropteridine diphosphokinase